MKRLSLFFTIVILMGFFSNVLRADSAVSFSRITYQNAYLLYDRTSGWVSPWDESMVFKNTGGDAVSITNLNDLYHTVSNEELKECKLTEVAYCLDMYSKNPGYKDSVYDASTFDELRGTFDESSIERMKKLFSFGYPEGNAYWHEHGVKDDFLIMCATQIALWGITCDPDDTHMERLMNTLSHEGTGFICNTAAYPNSPGADKMLEVMIGIALFGNEPEVSAPVVRVSSKGTLPEYEEAEGLYVYGFDLAVENVIGGFKVKLSGVDPSDVVECGDAFVKVSDDCFACERSEGSFELAVKSRAYDRDIALALIIENVSERAYEFYNIDDTYEGSPIQRMISFESISYADVIAGSALLSGEGLIRSGSLYVYKEGELLKDYENGRFIYENGLLDNTWFSLYADEACKSLLQSAKTQEGYAVFEGLSEGGYYLREEATPDDHVKDSTVYKVHIGPKDNEPVFVPVNITRNNKRKKLVMFALKTSDEGNPLEGAEYGLFAAEDIKNYRNEVIVTKDTCICKGESRADGKIVFDCEVPVGFDYYILELKAPYLYAIDEQRHYYSENGDMLFEVSDLPQKGSIAIYKKGDVLKGFENGDFVYEECFLDGIGFSIYSDSLCRNKLASGVTKAGRLVFDELLPGTYYVKEDNTLSHLMLSDEIYEVKIEPKASEKVIEAVDLRLLNDMHKIRLSLTKKDAVTGSLLCGAEYGVFAGENITAVTGDVIFEMDGCIKRVYTDKNGVADFDLSLPKGFTYYIREIAAPDGYVESERRFVADTRLGNEFAFEDREDSTHVRIEKVADVDGRYVAGAHLVIENSKHEIVYEFVTGLSPIEIDAMPPGIYYIKEVSAPEGYEVCEPLCIEVLKISDEQIFVVEDRARLGRFEYYTGFKSNGNARVEEVPPTGDEGFMKYIVMIAISGLMILFGRKKRAIRMLLIVACFMAFGNRVNVYAKEYYIYEKRDDDKFEEKIERDGYNYRLEKIDKIDNVEDNRSGKSYYSWVVYEINDIDAYDKKREISAYDKHYDEYVYAISEPTEIELIRSYWKNCDVFFLDFELKGDFIEYKGHIFEYDPESPNIDGFVDDILLELGLEKSTVRIENIKWDGDVYEKDGQKHRKAVAFGAMYVSDYAFRYIVEIPFRPVEEHYYMGTYGLVDEKPQDTNEQTIAATTAPAPEAASEETTNDSGEWNRYYIMLGIGVLVILVLLGFCVYLSRRRSLPLN